MKKIILILIFTAILASFMFLTSCTKTVIEVVEVPVPVETIVYDTIVENNTIYITSDYGDIVIERLNEDNISINSVNDLFNIKVVGYEGFSFKNIRVALNTGRFITKSIAVNDTKVTNVEDSIFFTRSELLNDSRYYLDLNEMNDFILDGGEYNFLISIETGAFDFNEILEVDLDIRLSFYDDWQGESGLIEYESSRDDNFLNTFYLVGNEDEGYAGIIVEDYNEYSFETIGDVVEGSLSIVYENIANDEVNLVDEESSHVFIVNGVEYNTQELNNLSGYSMTITNHGDDFMIEEGRSEMYRLSFSGPINSEIYIKGVNWNDEDGNSGFLTVGTIINLIN